MKNYKLHVSEGFQDTYGKEMLVKKEIEHKVLDIFKHHGFELIKTPTLEYLDVFSKDGLQKPDLYNLINRQGELLALCNDMTSSIARFVCSNVSLPFGIKKYCYIQDTFRYPRLYQGKHHQFLQAGVELIGDNGALADASIIHLASSCLKGCNVNDFTIHLGSSSFLSHLLNVFKIKDTNKFYELMDNKDYVSLRNYLNSLLDEDNTNLLINIILKGGKLHYIENLINKFDDSSLKEDLTYLKNVYLVLETLGVNNIVFDFSIYTYAKYYTGIIFEIYIDGVSKSVCSGGRLDSFLKTFGKDLSDCGFGLDIDSLAKYCLDKELIKTNKEKYLSCISLDNLKYENEINEKFRNEGIIVSTIVNTNIDEILKYAKDFSFNKIIYFNNNSYKLLEVK